ncbi:transporter [Streptococcus agalactiae]|uniref:cell wall-active antibiotics response protein LiaF n=1 Tax=Streptococcus agalactiae TaxID=1311 RepID=UPI001C9540A3|nr:cell wall-active antibiotics response protein LiaF [Streptococcus agalactiae]MBY4835504.1 transporter [Streptococcus agalactiae]MBY5053659.1 transporter [Streptococcus agalactiae]
MKKFQFFLLVEAVVLVMGLMKILSDDWTSFIFILALILLALRFYNNDSRHNFLLTTSLLLLFLIFMLNPYIIAAVVFAVLYVLINHFSQVKKKNRYALIQFKNHQLDVKTTRNQWLCTDQHESDFYAFEDINIIRISGTDTIDLTNVIVSGQDNVIIIQKVFGDTKVLVPLDVAVKADISSVYGSVQYFDFEEYDLRNESIKLSQEEEYYLLKRVKLVVNTIAGKVEVSRK